MKTRLPPQEDRTNGWSAILKERQPRSPLTQPTKAHWLVIGAGFAGLGAARRLAQLRPNDTVLVLEAGTVGENASGRNSGFAIDVPHNVGSSMTELRQAGVYKRLLASGLSSLETAVRTHGIECDWHRSGKYHCAASAHTARRTLQRHASELQAMGEEFSVLDREALAARIGTSYFHSGIYTPGCVLLNPAALVRGLADTLPGNVQLHENSPVVRVDFGSSIRACTLGASVEARHVVFANNALATGFGVLRHRMFPVTTFASLTRALSAEQQSRLSGERQWGVTPSNAIAGATLRRTPDQRILIRQEFLFLPSMRTSSTVRARILEQHERILEQRFPTLHDVAIEHFWAGSFAITRNGAPGWGRIARNAYSAVGCNGVGVVKQTILGSLIGDLATGTDNALIADARTLGRPNWMPPRPFLDLGVLGYLAKERWVGRREL